MNLHDPLALLGELVAIPSPSGEEAELADRIEAALRAEGIACERRGNTLLASFGAPRPGAPRLLYNSHLDTVPVGEGWTSDPYDPSWRAGRMVARGANDAKASVAAMLCAALALHREGALRGGELLVGLTECEETSQQGMTTLRAALGPLDAAVTGEPTGLQVVNAQAGLVVLTAGFRGVSCHAAHVARVPHDNALFRAAVAVAAMGPWRELEGGASDLPSTVAVTNFHAGRVHNVVPDAAEVVLDARILPPLDGEQVRAQVAAWLPGARVRVRSDRLQPVGTSPDHPLVQTALASAGQREAVASMTLSDMALLADVPAIKCGPGATARSHVADEYVLASEVLEGTRFYADLAPRWLRALTAKGAHP